MGDLHGDMGNARKVLRFSGVVDDKENWSGDVDFFVQTGDIIDRYTYSPLISVSISNNLTEAMIPYSFLRGWISYVLKLKKLVAPYFQYLVTMNG